MRFAYADPPYEGLAKMHYGKHRDYAGEVDHPALIARLVAEFPDGWALSCKTNSLRRLLPLCPESTRILAWVKPNATYKGGVPIVYAWEPILLVGGRKRGRGDFILDWLRTPATMFNRDGFVGAKPPAFCYWLFQLLNAQPGDELIDIFPGTGAVSHAWQGFLRQTRLEVEA